MHKNWKKYWFDRRPKRRSFLDALIPTPTPSPRPSQEKRRLEQLAAKTVPQESGWYHIDLVTDVLQLFHYCYHYQVKTFEKNCLQVQWASKHVPTSVVVAVKASGPAVTSNRLRVKCDHHHLLYLPGNSNCQVHSIRKHLKRMVHLFSNDWYEIDQKVDEIALQPQFIQKYLCFSRPASCKTSPTSETAASVDSHKVDISLLLLFLHPYINR